MENPKMAFLAFCIIIAPQIFLMVKAQNNPLVPAIYVLGSSSVDSGNNNYLNTIANANKWPYGIDLNNKRGRFSNGKNLADFAAIKLGLPMAPPYLGLSDSDRGQIKTGINYGSGSCGILNTSRVGDCLSLEKQVNYFTSTVKNDLPKQMNENELSDHLAKSIFLMFIGVNDYNPATNQHITDKFTGPAFADYLLQQLFQQIQTLYDLGARKFVVHGVSRCEPDDQEGTCISRYYRDKLPAKLTSLQASLSGAFFTMYDAYAVYENMVDNHEKYGIEEYQNPCFVIETQVLCPDRSKYHFFDKYGHQTERSCGIAMDGCFNGTFCTPYTLSQLATIH
ncbi:hypothetical protein QN277_006133 [Acacia crassicarpa]|uniref:GDSL esterase/lipase n=1 Tax=Acacia crassicarpa TaxID=499986 RepID=A0AAE1J0L0_9FABA|nr:hypothetical protein QN277_006133 [Acacia crassicarpa]